MISFEPSERINGIICDVTHTGKQIGSGVPWYKREKDKITVKEWLQWALCCFYLLILFIILVLSLLFANLSVWPSNKNSRFGARNVDKTAWCLRQFLLLLIIELFLWMKIMITTRRNVHHAVTNFLPHHEWCTQLPSAAVMMLSDGGSPSVDGKSVDWSALLNCTEEADA